jgi:hypothetical protein
VGHDDETNGDAENTRRGAELPERAITPNMLVAFNMARWRQVSGMTQEQVGERLGGWNKTAVSAAERSWDGKRIRQFDADLIASLATMFRVPFPAFFLPPPDDGVNVRYVFVTGDGGSIDMGHFFLYVMPDPDFEPDCHAGAVYQRAVIDAVAKYYDSPAASELAEQVRGLATAEQLAEALRTAQANYAVLDGFYGSIDELIKDNSLLQDALVRALLGTEEGRSLLRDVVVSGPEGPWNNLLGIEPGQQLQWGDIRAAYAEMIRMGTGVYVVEAFKGGLAVRPAEASDVGRLRPEKDGA